MKLTYDKDYTSTFHSPGIEPWITGFLKIKGSLGMVLDLGCGLGFTALLLKLYLNNVEYLVGLDINKDKAAKAKRLSLYDDLIVADARNLPFRNSVFDALISIEVLHGLPINVLDSLDGIIREKGLTILSLPRLPEGAVLNDLVQRGYMVYRYIVRGFMLVDLRDLRFYLASTSIFFRILKVALEVMKPLLRLFRVLERGYLLAFKG